MYKIVVVDESPDDIDNFHDYIEGHNLSGLLEVIDISPEPSIQETIDKIFDSNADAVVADYLLNEYRIIIDYNVPYNGVELVEEILKQRQEYPCFVMTSFDDDAIKSSADVNVVYQKSILHGAEKNSEASFVDRVIQQIEHYRARISTAEQEFNRLIDLAEKKELNALDESLLNELDGFLERTTHRKSAIPASLKTMKSDLHKLIENTDKLLEKLDGE